MADNLFNTSNFDQARNSLELTGLNAIRQQSKETDGDSKKAALQEAAQQFEAIFMQMLLKSMRKAEEVLESDSPFNSQSTKFYRDMHDQQMAVELSSNGSLGLTDLIVRQLGGGDDNFTPRTVLRNDGNLDVASNIKNETNLNIGINPNEEHNVSTLESANVLSALNKASQNTIDNLHSIPFVPSRKVTLETKSKEQSVNFSTPSFEAPKDFVSALTEPAKVLHVVVAPEPEATHVPEFCANALLQEKIIHNSIIKNNLAFINNRFG